MVMLWWWTIPVAVVLAVAAWFYGRHKRERSRPEDEPVWVANTGFLPRLTDYRRLMFRQRGFGSVAVAFVALALVMAAFVAARPMDKDVRYETTATRDVVLCLDVSGSMTPYDEQLVNTFTEIVNHFQGERIGMVVFNSTARVVFPLTDDYDLVLDELEHSRKIMSWGAGWGLNNAELQEFRDYYLGTLGLEEQASLIGDGLVSCAQLFDTAPTERSRTIILATDNQLYGTPLFTLPEAVDVVLDRDAVLTGLYAVPADPDSNTSSERQEFKDQVDRTGGLFYDVDSPDLVPEIVKDVTSQQIVNLDAEPEIEYTDHNTGFIIFTAVGLAGLMLVAWRLKA